MHKNTLCMNLQHFDSLPDSAMVDVKTVAVVLGRSPSSIWRDARLGTLPRPVKMGEACTRWNVGAIRRHLASLSYEESQPKAIVSTIVQHGTKTAITSTAEPAAEHVQAIDFLPSKAPTELLLKARRKALISPGIYLLFLGDEVVYIGQSTNPQARIGQHAMSKMMDFDSFCFIPIAIKDLDKEEAALIRRFRPHRNQAMNRD